MSPRSSTASVPSLTMADIFVEHLKRYVPKERSEGDAGRRGDRAALAALRRGLGKGVGEASEMYPYVVPALPRGIEGWGESCYYLIAALFGLYPRPWPREARRANLGVSLRWLARNRATERGEGGGNAPAGADGEAGDGGTGQGQLDPAVERRFVALLNATPDGFPEHLRYAVTLLRAHDIPVDWAQLLYDAQGWGRDERWVQRAWASAFWTSGAHDDERIVGGETAGAGVDDAAGSTDDN